MSEIESFYMWEENFCNDNEILLNIKTKKRKFQKKSKAKLKNYIAMMCQKLSV